MKAGCLELQPLGIHLGNDMRWFFQIDALEHGRVPPFDLQKQPHCTDGMRWRALQVNSTSHVYEHSWNSA